MIKKIKILFPDNFLKAKDLSKFSIFKLNFSKKKEIKRLQGW